MRFSLMFGAAAMAVATPAAADWYKAESKHFVIYADMPKEELLDYAKRLETFDSAARLVRSMNDPEVGDGNRVQVFVVPTMLDVNRTLGSADAGVGGYYVGTVTGPYIVTPYKARQMMDYRKLDPEIVFFHEYTHHLMLQSTNRPLPAWLTEGFAEFLANPTFNEDGSVGLGTPATHRAQAIIKGRWAPLEQLIEGRADKLGFNGWWSQNYAMGWLLTHYLSFEPSRKGQIDDYVKRISNGEPALEAARAAFGDLGQLESELQSYRRTKSFPYLKIDANKLTVPPVKVTKMSPGAADVMMMRIYSKTGYRGLTQDYVGKRVREIAERHPDDQLVLRTLAEVEYDAKNFDEAIAATDKILAQDPDNTEALIYKGRAILGKARKNSDPALFKEARELFIKTNHVDKEDPEALYLYYRTYYDAQQTAPDDAIEALRYAAALAPRDTFLKVRLAYEYLNRGELEKAALAIEPVAFLPHLGQSAQNDAYTILELIQDGKRDQALAVLNEELMPDREDDWAYKPSSH